MSATAAETPSDQPVPAVVAAPSHKPDHPRADANTSLRAPDASTASPPASGSALVGATPSAVASSAQRGQRTQFDQAAVERIIRRAQELGAPGAASDPGLTEDDLVAIGHEVGLSPEAVRRSTAIERVGPPEPRRRLDRLVGSATVTAIIDVPDRPGPVLQRTDALLVGGHHLRRDRLDTENGEWVRRRDPIGVAQRNLRRIAGEGELSSVTVVRARVAEIGDATVVRLEADRHGERLAYGAGGGAVGLVLAGGTAVVGLVLTPLALAGLPAAAAIGVGVASLGRRRERDLQRRVDRVSAQIQAGAEPRAISADLRDRLRRKQ